MAYSKLNLSKTYLNSQCTSLYCFLYWRKKCNIILLKLQYNLVQAMLLLLTSAISLSANMQSVQTMPVLRASLYWPILQWQTILASLSQSTPILQFHSSSSKIPFFSKCVVFSNILFSSNPPLQYNSLCWLKPKQYLFVQAMNPQFNGQHVCYTSPFSLPGFKP